MKNSREKEVTTILTIVLGFLALGFILKKDTLFIVALAVGVLGLLSKQLTTLIHKGWFALAEFMGTIMSSILLSAVFYLFLFPISLMYRIFNRDKLSLRMKSRDGIWINREYEYTKKDLEDMW